jgi:AcrR family transcriptional regulator
MTDVEDQRKRIIEAAMDIFAEFGFFRAPTQLIAMRAGVSKGLIFWYFKGKDELILESHRMHFQEK